VHDRKQPEKHFCRQLPRLIVSDRVEINQLHQRSGIIACEMPQAISFLTVLKPFLLIRYLPGFHRDHLTDCVNGWNSSKSFKPLAFFGRKRGELYGLTSFSAARIDKFRRAGLLSLMPSSRKTSNARILAHWQGWDVSKIRGVVDEKPATPVALFNCLHRTFQL